MKLDADQPSGNYKFSIKWDGWAGETATTGADDPLVLSKWDLVSVVVDLSSGSD